MLQIGHISAWVEVEKTELPQYLVEFSPDGQTAQCWIPSESGKEFAIRATNTQRNTVTMFKFKIDGNKISPSKMMPDKFSKPQSRYNSISKGGLSTSVNTRVPFIFAPINLTDDETFLIPRPGLGEIVVEVLETTLLHINVIRKYDVPSMTTTIHERSKKGVVHGIQFGPARNTPNPNATYIHKAINGKKLATFIFKYRPLDMLKADGIAPSDARIRSMTLDSVIAHLEAGPSLNEGSNDSEEDEETLNKLKSALEEELRKIKEKENRKRKRKRSEEDVKPMIKEERRRNQNELTEIIDLT